VKSAAYTLPASAGVVFLQVFPLIFLAQGAMGRTQSDKWIRLALIAEALRRHGRGKASRLIQVKKQIHRFLVQLLWAIRQELGVWLGSLG
jgi:hypothetical protein